MRNKLDQSNINNSDPANYPDGRIKNNTGGGNGTPVNEEVYGDIHEMKDKLMRLYNIEHNGLPDNETNGYQFVEALRALASKNDFCLNLTTASDILRVPLKLGKLLPDESFILKATIDFTTETQIRGTLDNVTKTVSVLGSFKQNEYVRMINTATSVVLVRMIDSFNLDSAVTDLMYMKGASLAEEYAGVIADKATSPLTNLNAYMRRVNGVDSGNYLAIPTSDANARNGLLSSVDKEKIDNLADPTSLIVITQASNVSVNAPGPRFSQDNFNFNYVDVFPPTGKTMANLAGFIASIAEINFAGDVNGDDTFWCKWQAQATKVRVICNSSERRSPGAKVNWMAIWI